MPVEDDGVNANTGASLDLITATVTAIRPIQDKIIPNGRSKETRTARVQILGKKDTKEKGNAATVRGE